MHPNQILEWKRKAQRGDLADLSPQLRAKDREIKELRELIGKQALELEFLKKATKLKQRGKDHFRNVSLVRQRLDVSWSEAMVIAVATLSGMMNSMDKPLLWAGCWISSAFEQGAL